MKVYPFLNLIPKPFKRLTSVPSIGPVHSGLYSINSFSSAQFASDVADLFNISLFTMYSSPKGYETDLGAWYGAEALNGLDPVV